ncbi:glycosyltransferase family 4 protein [Candidatus Peregrinibacteria bacterium CG_4_10_14_0_2_um_filter_38_24]|nr:MAG: glycosyltransferase family 4 protein [Candidatus Peregrinibacteria bacterium CG_4_10_14_0_2_um_filter_38_24]PJC39292.1 MAG: glycosyltransferase family 4 protein [Candidatus Peregrinibacteria bacterium CG_4_9_14_0_2_um_filter_38_9]
MSLAKAKIALVFDWMTNPGGAEKVNLLLHKMFPQAPIFTSIFNEKKIKGFEKAAITTSFIQNLPFAKNHHQIYLGMMPYAYENFDLSNFDIVISSSHACAKGIITKPETLHICYCHTPMRYAWDNWHSYIDNYKMNPILKFFGKRRIHGLRMWDRLSAERVDYFVANSTITKQRIEKYYNKPSSVIHPMIKASDFKISEKTGGYYLAVGRLTPYKKFDLIVDTFNQIGLPLKIVGTGLAEKELKASAKANIEFIGNTDDKTLRTLYSECEALIFPQVEDFGITAIEAMASGRPVIAYKKGGAIDSIEEGTTGIFFDKQNEIHLKAAIEEYQKIKNKFDPKEIRKHAEKFDEQEFENKFLSYLKDKWEHWQKTYY